MIRLNKIPDRDFIILNLTDTQLSDGEWAEGHKNRRILEKTVHELVERIRPDLITVSGDLAWAGNNLAYDMLADLLDSFRIPWAPVWGNHDNQDGAEAVDAVAERYLAHPYCVYEKGDSAIGNGNYILSIEEEGRMACALVMMDSHDRTPYTDENGKVINSWARLSEEQIGWYRDQISMLRENGCPESMIIMHIPFYAYRHAYQAAYKNADEESLKKLTVADAVPGADCWNEGYESSSGVMHEGICSHDRDDGVFEVVRDTGLTKAVLVGHDHVNNWIITYQGVKLVYALKTGAGCYWTPELNGGTVISVGSNGVKDIHHEFVDVSEIVNEA